MGSDIRCEMPDAECCCLWRGTCFARESYVRVAKHELNEHSSSTSLGVKRNVDRYTEASC